MYRADISIGVLKYFGVWCPSFSSKRIKLMYNIYSILMVSVVYVFTISTVLYLCLEKPNLEDFTESLFYVLALNSVCVKIAVVFIKHNKIKELRNMLLDEKCHPQDKIEDSIIRTFDEAGRKITTVFLVFSSITVILSATVPLMKGSNVTLPFKSWTPYKLENRKKFWLTYFLQAGGLIIAGQVNNAVDTFIMSMMIQLCAQLEILIYRVQKYPEFCLGKESDDNYRQIILGAWIDHHKSMYRFGKILNDTCNWVFFFQLCATTIDVCTSTYLLSIESVTTIKFWRMSFSLGGIMLQICLYCWPGNVVMEKSKEIAYAIYSMNWISLPSYSRINLVYIMKRSERPILFTAGKIFPMSINTFTSILRLSFSIYNFLMHSS